MAFHSDKFMSRYARLEKSIEGVYTLNPARYATDKVAVRVVPDNSGLKTRFNYLIDDLFCGPNSFTAHRLFSGRERAYILSLAQVERLLAAYKEKTHVSHPQ